MTLATTINSGLMQPPQKNKYQAYASATQTLGKTKQIVLLYDGLIRFLQQAKTAISENRIEDRFNLLIKASQLISGLQACLDFEQGGDIAKILYNFYASIDSRIFSVHRSNSIETCDEVLAEIKQMRDAWAQIDSEMVAQEAKNLAAAEPASPEIISSEPVTLEQGVAFSA